MIILAGNPVYILLIYLYIMTIYKADSRTTQVYIFRLRINIQQLSVKMLCLFELRIFLQFQSIRQIEHRLILTFAGRIQTQHRFVSSDCFSVVFHIKKQISQCSVEFLCTIFTYTFCQAAFINYIYSFIKFFLFFE